MILYDRVKSHELPQFAKKKNFVITIDFYLNLVLFETKVFKL